MAPANPPRRPDAALFALLLTIVWTILWVIGARREGLWDQLPNWDWSNYHSSALIIKQRITEHGFAGLVDGYLHAAGSHTPFLQLTSALAMFIFGESRFAAESVLILYTFIFAWASLRAIERVFDASTARWAMALYFCFPVLIIVSRIYLLEHPMSAFFSLSIWMMIESEGFSKWKPSILFGVFAGLACVTRLMGFVYFTGPAVVGFLWIMRRPDKKAAFIKYFTAGIISLLIAASWYVENFEDIRRYVGGVTFGARAKAFTGGSSPVSFQTIYYYLSWIIYEGPGVPLAAILAAFGVYVTFTKNRARLWSRPMAAGLLLAIVSFLTLFPSGQRVGARYFLPLMPILAVFFVRIVLCIPIAGLRRAAAIATAVFALAHPVSLTFTFEVPHQDEGGLGKEWFGVQLWNHRTLFLDLANSVKLEPRADLKMPEVVAAVEAAKAPEDATIYFMTDHPFFQIHAFRLEALRRRHSWKYGAAETLQLWDGEGFIDRTASDALSYDFIIFRTGGVNYGSLRDYGPIAQKLVNGDRPPFEPAGEPIFLGDGSLVKILRRRPPFGIIKNKSDIPMTMDVVFENDQESFHVVGAEVTKPASVIVIKFWLRLDAALDEIPISYIHIFNSSTPGDVLAGTATPAPVKLDPGDFTGAGPWYYYIEFEMPADRVVVNNNNNNDNAVTNNKPTPPLQAGFGFLTGDPMGRKAPPVRWKIKDAQNNPRADDNGTRLRTESFILDSAAGATQNK